MPQLARTLTARQYCKEFEQEPAPLTAHQVRDRDTKLEFYKQCEGLRKRLQFRPEWLLLVRDLVAAFSCALTAVFAGSSGTGIFNG